MITLLLSGSAGTKDVKVESRRRIYAPQSTGIVLLSEGEGQRKSVSRMAERDIRQELAHWSAETGTRRSLLCVTFICFSYLVKGPN